jgi:hypothetical protein
MMLHRKEIVSVLRMAWIVALAVWLVPAEVQATDAMVYKSPTCGCCSAWADHLKKNGFSVSVQKVENMDQVKAMHGVTPELASCHTAVIDGYVFEGHVPADVIRQFLKEKPKARGLAVPGMPGGSPGMEMAPKESYDILIFDSKGNRKVFTTR